MWSTLNSLKNTTTPKMVLPNAVDSTTQELLDFMCLKSALQLCITIFELKQQPNLNKLVNLFKLNYVDF